MEKFIFPKLSIAYNEKDIFIDNQLGAECFFIYDNDNKFDWAKDQVNSLLDLKQNWDGYGAIPISHSIIECAESFIACLDSTFIDKISDIFANPNGTITIEWENTSKEKISLEIGTNSYSYFVKFNNKAPLLKDGENIVFDFKDFASVLGELFINDLPKMLLL